jgi:hypothetical protein
MTRTGAEHVDAGGASRFFYVAKASTGERNLGLESTPDDAGSARPNDHPTVKPVTLMRYLCRLVAPPRGLVLDAFLGHSRQRLRWFRRPDRGRGIHSIHAAFLIAGRSRG